jgi:hypothetical protein
MITELRKGMRFRWREAIVVVTDQHSGSHAWLGSTEQDGEFPTPLDLHCLVRIESGETAGRIEPVLVSELLDL